MLKQEDQASGITELYEYDNLNRLTKVTKNGTVQQQYTYDVRGNRASQTGAFPDAAEDEVSLSYNLWNQLASVEIGTDTTSFEYGPTGLRVKKGSKNYLYDANGRLIAEADAVNTITATYRNGTFEPKVIEKR